MKTRLRIVVAGLIGQYPLGGVSWDYFQYILGLHQLGHDVYYLEDTGFWPYNPKENGLSATGCQYNIQYIRSIFKAYDLEDQWMFKFSADTSDDVWFGLSDAKRAEVLQSADLLINVSGCLYQPSDYQNISKLIYIDSDPVFTQIKVASKLDSIDKQLDAHDRLFTFAENVNHCIPETDYSWHATRQPIVLSEWCNTQKNRNCLSTVMNWTSYESLWFNGQEYGQKDREFTDYLDLPILLEQLDSETRLELAVNQGKTSRTPYLELTKHGWDLNDPNRVCADMNSYRHYIQTSIAEWSVAKNGYVAGKSGWFSCRSACYLASGRPVIVQDTGFTNVIGSGCGVYAFNDMNTAMAAIETVLNDQRKARTGALEVANAYFDSNHVLEQLIEDAFADSSSLDPVIKNRSECVYPNFPSVAG